VSLLGTLLAPVVLLLGLAIAALASRPGTLWPRIVYGGSLAIAIAIGAIATLALLTLHEPERLVLPIGLPWLGLHLRLDPLSAFFLLLLGIGAAIASLFALGYGGDEPEPGRILPFYPGFLAAMALVCLADDAFAFLFFWEVMSLLSFALVLVGHEEEANRDAARFYLVMAGFGTMTLLLVLGLLAGPEGSYDFDSIRARELGAGFTTPAFLLVIVGAGSKAGLVPFHVWLPLAHPAAPSPVSALMSGVMTKIALYGLLRFVFDLLGEPLWWWGTVLVGLGAGGAVLALVHALVERDAKRLLAWSTIENIGIVVAATGLALAFEAAGLHLPAALAATAALLHALNHTIFKTLLFCGAGAVLHATGTRDLEKLGGLIHRMPHTSLALLVGSAAISALPPLNGFVSEWLLFQAILVSPDLPQATLRLVIPAAGALLALAAALAAACFVRFYGIVFLGRPRSLEAAGAHEVDPLSRTGLLVPALLCLVLGVFPAPVIDLLGPVVTGLGLETSLAEQGVAGWLSLQPIPERRASYDGLVLFAFLILAGGFTAFLVHRLGGAGLRRGPIWDCGYPDPAPSTQYTAASMSQPIRRVMGSLVLAAEERVRMPPPLDPGPARLEVRLVDRVLDGLYRPLVGAILAVADRLNPLQFQTIRRYLVLVFLVLVSLLVITEAGR
jgi:formate hydrogenlyase subunit 3/multisubunit Na+/H+ antiporter MnhD subunit